MRQVYITVKEIKKLQKIFFNVALQEGLGITKTRFHRIIKKDDAIFSRQESDRLIEFLKSHNLQYIENEDTVIRDI